MRRRCLDCFTFISGNRSRCVGCRRTKERQRTAGRSSTVRDRLRKALNTTGSARCYLCGQTFPARYLELDHVIELADGGADHETNIRPACKSCHTKKTEQARRDRNG